MSSFDIDVVHYLYFCFIKNCWCFFCVFHQKYQKLKMNLNFENWFSRWFRLWWFLMSSMLLITSLYKKLKFQISVNKLVMLSNLACYIRFSQHFFTVLIIFDRNKCWKIFHFLIHEITFVCQRASSLNLISYI